MRLDPVPARPVEELLAAFPGRAVVHELLVDLRAPLTTGLNLILEQLGRLKVDLIWIEAQSSNGRTVVRCRLTTECPSLLVETVVSWSSVIGASILSTLSNSRPGAAPSRGFDEAEGQS